MARPVVFMTGAGGGMGYASFQKMLPDLGRLYDLLILVRDSDKNRKLFERWIGTPGIRVRFGDLLNKWTSDVVDDDEVAPKGFIKLFQGLIDFFKKIMNFIKGIFG